MHLSFKKWIEDKSAELLTNGIKTIIVRFIEPDGELADPVIVVEHLASEYMGEVMVWQSGNMDFEVLEVDSGKMILWQHKELECESEFEDALKEYFDVLLGKELSR